MSIENVLCYFPKEERPEIYTGLFEKRVADRALSNKPNKSLHGVSATRYAEALDVKVGVDKAGDTVALFDMFHGYCDGFAYYFAKKASGMEHRHRKTGRILEEPCPRILCILAKWTSMLCGCKRNHG